MTNTYNNETWDLDNIYPSFHVWEIEYEKIKKEIEEFSINNQNKIAQDLLSVLKNLINIERNLSKLYLYAKLNYDLDSLKDINSILLNKVNNLLDIFSFNTDFVQIEILKLSNNNLINQYKNNQDLKEYKFLIDKIRQEKKHFLSLKEENILSKMATILDTNSRIFDKLNDTDCNFGMINDEELTHGNYHNFIINKDQNIRKQAFTQYHEYYKNHANTISDCLITEIKSNIVISNLRKYNDPLTMYLNPDKVSIKVYDNLISEVRNNLNLFDEYLRIRKKELGLKEIHMYDLYVPLNEDIKLEYSYEDAKKIVLESIKPLGEDYFKIAQDGLNSNWVDVYPSKGKTSGAYSSGTYDTKPYILLNYNNTLNSIETLAHELGHSMHSYYSRLSNPYHYSDYSILLAEIASNTHELLLFDYLLKNSTDTKMKKRILETILDSFKGSIFRQTEFAEFEKIIHEKELKEPLTKENILNTYSSLNNDYYGREVIQDELIKYEALRIPHFYSSFYVYKYAIGLAIAYIFAKKIIDKEKNAINNYLKFISFGSKDYPLEILKECGINLEKDHVIKEALKIFANYLDEYKKLM